MIGLLLIVALVACVFGAAAVMVALLDAEPEFAPPLVGHLTYAEEPESDDELLLVAEVEAWLAREDFR